MWGTLRTGYDSFGGVYPGPVAVIGVLALQGDVREHLAALAAAGDVRAVPVRRPAELDTVDALTSKQRTARSAP